MPRFLPPRLLVLLLSAAAATWTGCNGNPGCRVNLDCPSGQVCLNGSCTTNPLRGCGTNSDCPSGDVCTNAVCQPDCVVQGCPTGDRCDPASHLCLIVFYATATGDPPPPTTSGTTSGTTTGGSTGGTTTGGTTGSGTTTGAMPAPYCSSCASSSCGPVTSVCMQDARGFDFCGTDCTEGQACPMGAQCNPTGKFNPQTGQAIANCFPTSFLCYCSTNGDTWTNYAQAFFAMTCETCHSQYGSQLTQFTSYQNVKNAAPTIQIQVGYKNMPLNGTLTQDERARLLNWLDCGLPE